MPKVFTPCRFFSHSIGRIWIIYNDAEFNGIVYIQYYVIGTDKLS